MTEMKTKKHGNNWFEPALWMKAGDINFHEKVVRINGKMYTTGSKKFAKAYDDDRIIRMLKQ